MKRLQHAIGRELNRFGPALCAGLAIAMAVAPFARTPYRMEIDYNEGWNVYNAALVQQHQLLYPVRYGFTSVNYPMLWFVILAKLHHLTGEYLFTARVLSLVGLLSSCFLVSAIVRSMQSSWRSACLAGFFCLGLFVTTADEYIGMADPQLFAQIFFLAALLIYVRYRGNMFALAAAALLFVVGGSIKHNPIDIPLAVLIDLLFIAPAKALWFSTFGLLLLGVSVWLNIHYGGPFFVAQFLAPRQYSISKAVVQGASVLGPLLLPLCASIFIAFTMRRDHSRRISAILLATSFVLCTYFYGGSGVSINAYFSLFLAISITAGLVFDHFENAKLAWLRPVTPVVFFLWLLIPWLLVPELDTGRWNPWTNLQEAHSRQTEFRDEVAILHQTSGPVICESLLLCAMAQKPYVYDPFNTTRLVRLHRLSLQPLIDKVHEKDFAAIELNEPIAKERNSERFDPTLIEAIDQAYELKFSTESGWLYFPKPNTR